MNLRALHQGHPGPLRAGIGALSLLYLSLTVSALLCVLDHGVALAGMACHQSMSSAMSTGDMHAGMGGGMGDGHHASLSLCDCLDKLAAHGVAMPPAGILPAPSTDVVPLAAEAFPPSAETGVLPARGPPARGFSA